MTRNGQVVLITGAGSGMGQLAARNMADAGANIAALDIDEAGLAQTAEGRPGITPLPCDVTNASAVAAAAKQVETEIGPIERVFAAAAIMPTGKLLDQAPFKNSGGIGGLWNCLLMVDEHLLEVPF